MMNRKRAITLTTAIVLCLAIVAGATFAYLNSTDTKTNTMTYIGKDGNPNEAVKIELRETLWDGVNFSAGPVDPSIPTDTSQLGVNKANLFNIGDVMPKNPTVMMIGSTAYPTATAYIGLVVKGETGGLTLPQMEQIYTINWNTTNWDLVGTATDGSKYFIYKGNATNTTGILAKDARTEPLFTSVTVKAKDSGNSTIFDMITYTNPGGALDHDIIVDAYAVQAVNESFAGTWDAKTALKAEFSSTNPGQTNHEWDKIS